jgi:hypothetical protein
VGPGLGSQQNNDTETPNAFYIFYGFSHPFLYQAVLSLTLFMFGIFRTQNINSALPLDDATAIAHHFNR